MKTEWSLTALYPSFEDETFKKDKVLLEVTIQQLNEWVVKHFTKESNPKEVLETYIEKKCAILSTGIRLSAFSNLTLATEATHSLAMQSLNELRQCMSAHTFAHVSFLKYLSQIPQLDDVIASSLILTEHKYFLTHAASKATYLLEDAEEMMISNMKTTGSSAWSDLQNMLTSTLDVEVEGYQDTMPLPAVRNLAYEASRQKREAGYNAEMRAYKAIETSSAAALNAIKGEVSFISKKRGYASVLEETVIQSKMKQETLDAMLQAMEESLPKFREYFKTKATLLGHEQGLPFYDLFAPMGEADLVYSYEEAKDVILDTFGSFSQSLRSFAQYAFENEWIDALPKSGKRGGAFCSGIHPIKQSRVLANFDGSFSQTKTLAHELGHAYHAHMLKDESILNTDITMPIAETASIFCETILKQAALKTATPEQQFSILEIDLQGSSQVIVDIYSRFLFERSLFDAREKQTLSPSQLCDLMCDAQRRAYGDGLDEAYLHPYMWINKPHYYSAGLSYYNFPYAFGLLFAKGVYAAYLEKGESFVEEYDLLLQATGKNNIEEVAMMIGIDITSTDFWRTSLNTIIEDIDLFIALAKTQK